MQTYNKLVRDKIPKIPDYTDVETIRQKKREERGGFDRRIILKGQKD